MIERPGRLRFRILGPLEVWTGGAWKPVTAEKQRALLATLLLKRGQPVSTGELIEQIWRGEPPPRAKNLVAGYVLALRRLLDDASASMLATRAPGYQIILGPGELDAEVFTGLLEEGRKAWSRGDAISAADLLTGALGCWRGKPLVDVPETELVRAESGLLESSRAEALGLWAQACLAYGRPSEIIPGLRRALTDNALQEEWWALLMRALHAAGRPAEALEAYARARRVIADELGVDPGAELRELYQRILKGEPSQESTTRRRPGTWRPPIPAQLPADIADFTGRGEQVEMLKRLLAGAPGNGSPGAVRVVLVVGSGGLGKTTLAVHTAHLLTQEFPDGQLYANLLGASHPASPSEVLARFLRDLGLDGARIPASEEERAAHYRTRLAGRRLLIVLDDARDAAQVQTLLPGSASCAVLVTARGMLPELAGSSVLDLEMLPANEAHALFARVAGEERVSAEPMATERVLTACAGLPLAIRIAGARLTTRTNWSVRALADRLSDERHRLHELQVGNLAVQASFEVSFASLPRSAGPGEVDPARAFRLLGLWTGPSISLPAAAALIGELRPAVGDALDVLVDAHLLESPLPDRYRFHDLLRVHAAGRAEEEETEEDREAAITRVLIWYLHTTEAAARVISPQHSRVPLGPPPPMVRPQDFATLEEAIDWCESKRAGLLAATRLAAAHGLHEIAWKLPAAAMSFYYRRSHWGDWVATHEIGIDNARALHDRQAEAWMLNNLGMAYGVQHLEQSASHFSDALAIYRDLGDQRGEARAANNVAIACFDLGRYVEALAAGERSLEIQQSAGDRYGEGLALGVKGSAQRELGQFTEAVQTLQEALAIFRELGDAEPEAVTLYDLGDTYLRLGERGEAISCLQQSLAIRRSIGNRYGQAATLLRLGPALALSGDTRRAREALTVALSLFEELGDHAQAGETRSALAEITREDG